MVTKQEKGVGGINLEFGINRYIVLCIKQIISKDLLDNTRNSILCSVITYMGIESEKEEIYIY